MQRRPPSGRGHELLEHLSDLGIRAWGPTPEEAYEEAVLALLDVLDVPAERAGETERLALEGTGREDLLVDLLNELVFLVETRGQGVAAVRVLAASEARIEATVDLGPLARPSEGTVVKAATYHRLGVDVAEDGATTVWVFLDV